MFNLRGSLELFELAIRGQCMKDTTVSSLLRGGQKSANVFSFSFGKFSTQVLCFLCGTVLFKSFF